MAPLWSARGGAKLQTMMKFAVGVRASLHPQDRTGQDRTGRDSKEAHSKQEVKILGTEVEKATGLGS